jgi:hypothetical protein
MSEHLSPLELDEAAADLASPPHLAQCARCQQRVKALKADAGSMLDRPEAKAQLERLTKPKAARPSPWLLLVSLAATLGLFFLVTDPPKDRVKGAPTILLLDSAQNPVSTADIGQHLTLSVTAPAAKAVTVFATTRPNQRETLWSGDIKSGQRNDLMDLVVTPGDVELEAVFTSPDSTNATAKMTLKVR